MTKKEVLLASYYLLLLYITYRFLFVKADTLSMIILSIGYYLLVLKLIRKVKKEVYSYILFIWTKKLVEELEDSYKLMVLCYAIGLKNEAKKLDVTSKRRLNDILHLGEKNISDNVLRKKYSQRMQEIVDQTKMLMNAFETYDRWLE